MPKRKGTVISLFDFSAEAVKPWAEAGYACYCLDLLHPHTTIEEVGINLIHADLDLGGSGWIMARRIAREAIHRPGIRVLMAWPPCEDMTTSGNRHLAVKRAKDPNFQRKAAARAILSDSFARDWGFRSFIENPVGALCRLWRRPDAIWNPYEFGGYLPPEEYNPFYPDHIAPRDAYTKRSGAWLGGGFIWPEPRPVEPEILVRVTKSGRTIKGSRQFMMLGGSSKRTKSIRNLTPRGLSLALFQANHQE